MHYIIERTAKHCYVAKAYFPRDNYPDKRVYCITLWGAKKAIKSLKKHYAYCKKHNLPRVLWEGKD